MKNHIVGLIVKQDRKDKLMTLKTYAEQIGISVSYLSDIENGRRLDLPDLDAVNRVLEYAGFKLELKLTVLEENAGSVGKLRCLKSSGCN